MPVEQNLFEQFNTTDEILVEKHLPTGDKVYEGSVVRHSEDPDSMLFDDNLIVYDKELQEVINSYVPSKVFNSSEWKVISLLLALLATKTNVNLQNLLRVYNTMDLFSDYDKLMELARLFSIDVPKDYPQEKLVLLIKKWPALYNMRGTEEAVLNLFKILERTEYDLYLNDLDDTYITKISYGNYSVVHNSRIKNLDFARELTRRLMPNGRGYQVTNKTYIKDYKSAGITYIYNDVQYPMILDDEESIIDTYASALDGNSPLFNVYQIGEVLGF